MSLKARLSSVAERQSFETLAFAGRLMSVAERQSLGILALAGRTISVTERRSFGTLALAGRLVVELHEVCKNNFFNHLTHCQVHAGR